jgi:serine/threonine protein kinase
MKSRNDLLKFLSGPDRYMELHTLGKGGMGNVLALFDGWLQRVVACKLLNSERLDDTDLVQTFLNEMKLMGHLNHPGILAIYDALLGPSGEPAYTMKLAEGETLTRVLKVKKGSPECEPLPLEQAVRILSKLAEALSYAHDHGIIHLDLKPDNIMIGRYGEVLIMDWGAARVYDVGKYDAGLRRLTDKVEHHERIVENRDLQIGTPGYMSPEQIRDSRDSLGPASDIFSVGVIFYQMLTGLNPFRGASSEESRARILKHDPPPANELNRDVPQSLARICAKMLEKRVPDRHAGFEDVLRAIDDFQRSAAGFPTRAFEAGEVVFQEGDPSDYVCIVVSGRIEISVAADGERRVIAVLGVNEPFGELAALTGNPRTATATALERSVVRMVSRRDIAAEIQNLSPWVGTMVEALSNRFIETSERLLELEKGKTA